MLRFSLASLVSLLLSTSLSGCYVQRPADPLGIRPGEDLTIVLSAAGRARLGETSTLAGEEVTGQFVSVSRDSLALTARLPSVTGAPSTGSTLRQTLSFARADIERVSVPELHRGRTTAVLVGLAAIAAWVAFDLFDINGNGQGPVGTPPPPPSPFGPGR